MKKVSVIVPAYNAEMTLANCLESILAQSYHDIEIVIIDDKSNDRTLDIARKYEEQYQSVIVIQSDANGGAGRARNLGIKAASGQYIAFLDADDFWYKDKITRQVGILETTDNYMVVSGYEIVNSDGVLISERRPPAKIRYKDLLKFNCIGCLTVIYSVEKIGKHYFPTLRKRQDYALWLILAKLYGDIVSDNMISAKYMKQSGSLSANKFEMLKWNYMMFKNTQNFNFFKAAYFVSVNAFYKLMRF
jgi:teichuronic acid biosynthesis glycosyltransferase TuaG